MSGSKRRSRNAAQLDRRYVWHPFTQMQDWVREKPIVIAKGQGALLYDSEGREYLDANASIWTNLHGHAHPVIDRAIRNQLAAVSHTSALGLANVPASHLAAELISLTQLRKKTASPQPRLKKVFYSDDGSTAMEVALKLHFEHQRRSRPEIAPRFLSLENSYHGDTVGAMSLGHSPLFHQAFKSIRFRVDRVMAPYCYRCPYNRARPDRTDARLTRRCQWECVGLIEKSLGQARKKNRPYTAFVTEPIVQGAAGMIVHPEGWLARTAALVRGHGLQLIADEVMTGFGRTGPPIACHQEGVQPDFLALAKGLTGGYLPMAATLTTQAVFDSFLGPYEDFRTFFHGHSFTANQLGSAAALASLELLRRPAATARRRRLESWFDQALQTLWRLPQIGDVRRAGLVAGVELVKNWRTREPFPLSEQAGIRVCRELARRGVLTRPIGNVIVLMPIYCLTRPQLNTIVGRLAEAVETVLESDVRQ